jgi:hypothetical protein
MMAGKVLRARIERTRDGLYRAAFLNEPPAEGSPEAIPDVQVGTSEADVRVRVEGMAQGLGYTRVIWEIDAGPA